MQIIYLNNMYEAEEEILKKHGLMTARVEISDLRAMAELPDGSLFRGPKMNAEQYKEFAEKIGIKKLFVTPSQYGIAADAISYSKCFGEYSPKTLAFDIGESEKEIAAKLRSVRLPLFVRSNVESAAKYVGVEACMLKSLDQLGLVLQPIYENIKTAETIIMKEVVALKRINERTVEYRAIVIGDQVICFDYNASCELPDPMELQWRSIVETASRNGMHGAYFLDLGVDESDRLFVVECKNLLNGTIKNIDIFAEGLKRIC